MGESHHQAATSSRLGIRNTAGEIVEVQGDRIVRSTGRKDRHSKVCTTKGPRDRRVRLSAHTAIQFYDVQDRLGYDRPSKTVDWLIKKAKAAIDELAELPPWNPATAATKSKATKNTHQQEQNVSDDREYHQFTMETGGGGSTSKTAGTGSDTQSLQHQHHQQHQHQIVEDVNNNNNSPSFLPPSLDSDAIADTIKSFFPMGASVETSSASIQFQSYPPDLLSRTSSQSQDLKLSLQSFQEPILLQHHGLDGAGHSQAQSEQQQVLFSGSAGGHHHHLGFDGPSEGWSEQHHHHPAEINRIQRMVAWNAGAAADGGGNSGSGFMFNPPPTVSSPSLLQPFFGHNQFFSQRGPLQSSNTPSVRAWIDPAMAADHHQIPQIHQQHSLISSLGFAPTHGGGFSGFRIPARIQGEEEEHDGIPSKPSSASSDYRRSFSKN